MFSRSLDAVIFMSTFYHVRTILEYSTYDSLDGVSEGLNEWVHRLAGAAAPKTRGTTIHGRSRMPATAVDTDVQVRRLFSCRLACMSKVECPAIDSEVGVKEPICIA